MAKVKLGEKLAVIKKLNQRVQMNPLDLSTKNFLFSNLPFFIKSLADAQAIDQMYPFDTDRTKAYVFANPYLVETHTNVHTHPSQTSVVQPDKVHISMSVLTGLVAARGLAMAALGVVGLFAKGLSGRNQTEKHFSPAL